MTLEERMAATVKGQVTWADPSKGAKCISCAHIIKVPEDELNSFVYPGNVNRCTLVKLHTKKKGVIFNGSRAIACSMYVKKDA
jgi:hypothetical protein